MKTIITALFALALLTVGSAAFASPILHAEASAPIILCVQPWVEIGFVGVPSIMVDVEAGVNEHGHEINPLTVVAGHNCNSLVGVSIDRHGDDTNGITLTPTLQFPNVAGALQVSQNSVILQGAGIANGCVGINADGNDIHNLAGYHCGGRVIVTIDSLFVAQPCPPCI